LEPGTLTVCNDYANRVAFNAYREAFSQTRLPLLRPGPEAAPNLEPRDDIRPTDVAPVIRAVEGGVELVQLRWGFAPGRPKAGPVINFRSEGRAFDRGRCLIPASAFYEFTGARYPKTKWRFTVPGEDWFCIAGLWRPARDDWPESFTMLTLAPGPDIAPYHDRQVAVLDRSDWERWLELGDPDVLHPAKAGSLQVRPAAEAAAPRLLSS
jgi:putative SOS response-associated peptidase YedK